MKKLKLIQQHFRMECSLTIQTSLFVLLLFIFQLPSAIAGTPGCYVRDGGRDLYSFTDGSIVNICGNNVKVYSLNSKVAKSDLCIWTPTFPVANYNCVIMPGGYCGILGNYEIECDLDNHTWLLMLFMAVFSIFLLRQNGIAKLQCNFKINSILQAIVIAT